MGAPARAAQYAADTLVVAGPCSLRGWSLRETASAVATVIIRNGTAAGAILGEIRLAADASETEGDLDVYAPDGIFADIVAGSVEGAIYYA